MLKKTTELVFFSSSNVYSIQLVFGIWYWYFGASLVLIRPFLFHQTKMSIYISLDDTGDAWQAMVSSHFMQREKAVCIGRVNSTHFLKEKQKNQLFQRQMPVKWNPHSKSIHQMFHKVNCRQQSPPWRSRSASGSVEECEWNGIWGDNLHCIHHQHHQH